MQIAGVVAEYNPFHCGHAYHLRRTKEFGADAVVAVMSGDYVQRGTPAILSKYPRAKIAAQCGADLVLELPVPWAIGRAQSFADGAVSVLRQLGCVDILSFGSECGDASLLRQAVSAVQNEECNALTQQIVSGGNVTFAAAREQAVSRLYGEETAGVFRNPNDTLAVEYMLASARHGADFRYIAVPRIGRHDAQNADDGFPSASQIRERLLDGMPIFGCPAEAESVWNEQARSGLAPADLRHMERAILADWRTASAEELSALPDVSEGLEMRIQDAAYRASSLAELYDLAKTKRYTHARIRRIVLARFLRITRQDILGQVPYLRVLAVGEKGREILRIAKRTCAVPILSRAADQKVTDPVSHKLLQTERRAGELYGLLLPNVQRADSELQAQIYISE